MPRSPEKKSRSEPRRGWDEQRVVAMLTRVFSGGETSADVELSIGDDAALLKVARAGGRGRERLVLSVDACVEQVHFDPSWLSLSDLGFRAVQAAASDLAAMGARPLSALTSWIVPEHFSLAELTKLARGQAAAARMLACPIVGGNVSSGSELSLTTTVAGMTAHPLLRRGARPGDDLWLVGSVGKAKAGLLLLQRRSGRRSRATRACLRAWRRPRALLEYGGLLAGRASAAIDLSDGLAIDASRLAASSGVRLVLDAALVERTLRRELREAAGLLNLSALELALDGGEDYALLATGRARNRPPWAEPVGKVERGRGLVIQGLPEGLDGRRFGYMHGTPKQASKGKV